MNTPTSRPTLRHFLPKSSPTSRSLRGASLEHYLFENPHNPTRREQALWRAVILQMVTDALSHSRKAETLRYRREARAWINGFGRDFRTVSEYAGYDPVYLHERIQALLHAQADAMHHPVAPAVQSPHLPTTPIDSAYRLQNASVTLRFNASAHREKQSADEQ